MVNTMKNKSIWEKSLKQNIYQKPKNNIVDILIVGGGITGITTAFYLKDYQGKILLIDQNKILHGTTLYTTAKITTMQDTVYNDISSCYNDDVAFKYYQSQDIACQLVKENIDKYNINCDYNINDSYIFAQTNNDIKKINKIENFFNKYNIDYTVEKKLPNNFPILYSIKKSGATFNPINYLYGLLKECHNLSIYEETNMINIKKNDNSYAIKTNHGIIKAKIIIIVSNYPSFIFPELIPLKTHIKKSHVVACKLQSKSNFNAISIGKETISMRFYNDYFIFGGNSYNLFNHIDHEKYKKELCNKFMKYFDNDIIYSWSTHDVVANDYLPIIGEIDNNLFLATAYNAWGMTNGTLAGKIISDYILNKNNDFFDLFNPKRNISLKKVFNSLYSNFNIIKIFLETKLIKNKSFYRKDVYFITENGKSYGVYIDENNIKHKIRNLCPHMKCSLIFNYDDKTWDCPCHGSRFDIDGNVIKGPSCKNIKK